LQGVIPTEEKLLSLWRGRRHPGIAGGYT